MPPISRLTVFAVVGLLTVFAAGCSSPRSERPSVQESTQAALRVAQVVFPHEAEKVYVANVQFPADAVIAASASDGPVLLADQGQLPPAAEEYLQQLRPAEVVMIRSGASPEIIIPTQSGIVQVTGTTAVETSARFALLTFPTGTDVAYLVPSGHRTEMVLATTLPSAPLLIVDQTAGLSTEIKTALARLGSPRTIQIGGSRLSGVDELISGRTTADTAVHTSVLAAASTDTYRLLNEEQLANQLTVGTLPDSFTLLSNATDVPPGHVSLPILPRW